MMATALAAGSLGVSAPAAADGTLTLRGAYYKERSTRVIQPMMDAAFQVGDHGTATGHLLVDAITSASASSGAADTAFTERRYEGGGGYAHELSWGLLRGNLRLSSEPDYTSVFAGAGAELAFAEKNTVVAVSGGAGHDTITNAGAQGPFSAQLEDTLSTVLGATSVSQLLSPNLVVSAGYDLSYLRGYQQNPYRTVIVGSDLIAERHPETRTRHAVAATGKWYLPEASATAIAGYRFYADSWGVLAHTPELRLVKILGEDDDLEATVRYRFHWQRRADFVKREYRMTDEYLTDDEKLVSFTSHTLEAKLALLGAVLGFSGTLGEARGELILQYVDQNNRFGNAITAQAALTLPFEY
ncbi:MAG: DUF3570 domain-containing protein [Myxococcales bacterium]|nr:DUF3570 domain-containing protein [Myxococcales bacterium]